MFCRLLSLNHYLTNLFVVLFWNSTENQYHFVVLKSFVFGDFRTEFENSKNPASFSNPVRVSFWILADGVDTLFASFLFCFFVPTTAQPLRFGRANMFITGRWLCFFMPRGHLRKAVRNTCILSLLAFSFLHSS